jgi:nitronate monooxygenase
MDRIINLNQDHQMSSIKTSLTELLGCQLPIIGAPMFLVSNIKMVVAVSEGGGVGTFPALNYRPLEKYAEALKEIKARTTQPIGVNIIVNKSNSRQADDMRVALDAGVNLFITSLGNPKSVISDAHKNGAKVFCDVTNLEFGLKVQDLGADGVIAVGSGAGGHAGPISPLVLIPWLTKKLEIPVIAAGGVANGATMAACLALGAAGVSIGTRFIASKEADIDPSYKQAVVTASPEDILLTSRISGSPASVIRTDYIQKKGLELPLPIRILKNHPVSKKYVVPMIHWLGMKSLQKAAEGTTWKSVWSAGQSVGLIDEILSCREILEKLVSEYEVARQALPPLSPSLSSSPLR